MGRKKKPDKLAQDAAKALAAGLSYGKWRAMQQPVQVEKESEKDYKTCPNCGKKFKAGRNKKFCDAYCRNQAYYDKEMEIQKARYYRKKEQQNGKE